MKRLLLLLCFGILVSIAANPSYENVIYIPFSPPLTPYKTLWEAVCTVESKNDPNAVGDKKLRNKSYGIAQIRKPRLDDYFEKTGIRYTNQDMFDTTKAKSVFMWYAMQNGPYEIDKTIMQWNGGPVGHKKKSTIIYLKKVKKHLELIK